MLSLFSHQLLYNCMFYQSTYFKWALNILILPIISGICMHFAWPTKGWFPMLFVGLIPWIFALNFFANLETKWRFVGIFVATFISHFTWTYLSMFWLEATSPKTFLVATLFDSFVLAFVFLFVPYKSTKKWMFFVGVLSAWLFVEYFNQHWIIAAPYFLLGHGFGMNPAMIQFYEFVGIEGGSLLLILINLIGFEVLSKLIDNKPIKKNSLLYVSLFSPYILSFLTFSPVEKEDTKKFENVVVLHTFINQAAEELTSNPKLAVDSLWQQSEKFIDSNTSLLVWPETIIVQLGWLNGLPSELAYQTLVEKLKNYPNLSLCIGGYGYSVTKNGAEDPYARFFEAANVHFLTHNVAVTLSNAGRWPVRSKLKFIPFQERIPFLKQFPSMANFADVVGSNTMVSYYEKSEDIHKTFKGTSYAPILCFESIYPLDMAAKANESQFIVILANENWNKDLSGSTQYLYTNVGMAIQSRVPIVRSSNSGTSAILNSKGVILETKFANEIGAIKKDISIREAGQSFYNRISGVFYILASFVYVGLIFLSLLKKVGFVKK
jgi:apolipoprotein N-acyltransferase